MGVTANPDDLHHFAAIFKAIPESEPALKPATLAGPGPLSPDLSLAGNASQGEAVDFATAMDAGIVAAGDVLSRYATRLVEEDRKGADGMRKALPTAPTSPAS